MWVTIVCIIQGTLWGIHSVVKFCFVSDRKFQLPTGVHSSCSISLQAAGRCQKYFTKYHDWVDAPECIINRRVIGPESSMRYWTIWIGKNGNRQTWGGTAWRGSCARGSWPAGGCAPNSGAAVVWDRPHGILNHDRNMFKFEDLERSYTASFIQSFAKF